MNSIHSVYLIDFNKVCRTCLGTGTLNPIFSGIEDEDVYSAKIFNSAGIKISSNDGLPQNMCADCVNYLNSNIKFREKCRITENELLTIKNKINISEDVGDGAEDSESGSCIEDDSEDRSTTRKKSVIVDAKSLVPKNPLELEITFGSAVKIEKLGDIKKENEDIKEFDDSINFHSEALQIDSQGNNHGSMLGNLITFKADSKTGDMKLSLDDLEISKTDANVKLKSSNISTPNWNPSIKNSDSLIHCLIPLTDDSKSPVDDSNFLIENSNPVTDDLIHINPSKRRKKCSDINVIADIHTIGTDKSRRRVMCKLCGKNLSFRSLNCHMLAKHPQVDSRREKCEMCEKMILKNKMEKHCEKFHGVHGEKANFLCAYCKSIFKIKEGLMEHIATCTERKKRKKGSERGRELKPCDVCGKMMQKASLRHHNAVAHSGLGPVCEHCGKRFANKIRLDEHCRAKHGYEKYKCTVCDFRSSGLMAMRNHERRHRGEKPFVCETCGAKFHAAYLLTQHRQTHRKEKVVKCDLCTASFKANNSLHMHKITCHSNSTYKCYLCERIFSCRHYVVKHLRHFHSYQGKVGKIEKIEGKVLLPGRSRMEENKED